VVALKKLPSNEEAQWASAAVSALSKLRASHQNMCQIDVHSEGQRVSVNIPAEAFDGFLELLGQMANGNAVTIVPVHAELTTQEAADLINVSRPHLVSLLDDGKIPFHKVGTHRRVKAADLFVFKEKLDAASKAAADELTREAQDLDLGY
jgi:excisionase family DNA binding protein